MTEEIYQILKEKVERYENLLADLHQEEQWLKYYEDLKKSGRFFQVRIETSLPALGHDNQVLTIHAHRDSLAELLMDWIVNDHGLIKQELKEL